MTASPKPVPADLIGRIVSVHYNLTRGDYVVAVKPGGFVQGYAAAVVLENVEFRVREGTRLRVISSGHRSVHAYAVGRLISVDAVPADLERLERITYNPHRSGSFHVASSGRPIDHAAGRVIFSGRYCYV